MSAPTLTKASAVVEAAKTHPEHYSDIAEEMDRAPKKPLRGQGRLGMRIERPWTLSKDLKLKRLVSGFQLYVLALSTRLMQRRRGRIVGGSCGFHGSVPHSGHRSGVARRS